MSVLYQTTFEHNCTNTIGSYTCSCMSSYVLQSDLFWCIESGLCLLTAQAIIVTVSADTDNSAVRGMSFSNDFYRNY